MLESHEATHLLNKEINNITLAATQITLLSTESTSLSIQHAPVAQPNNPGKWWGARIGYTCTTMAMVIQATLAFLLWELVWRNLARNVLSPILYELILYLVGGPLFIGSLVGKIALFIPYNTKTFERLGISAYKLTQNKNEWLIDTKDYFRHWSTKDILFAILNTVMTINASIVFGVGLTNLGVNGIAILLDAYNKPFLNLLARMVVTYYFQSPFIAASIICNLLGFPFVHINAAARLKQFFFFLMTNPRYMHLKKDLHRCLLAANVQWKQCADNKDSEATNKFFTEIFNLTADEQFNFNIHELTLQRVRTAEKQTSAESSQLPTVLNQCPVEWHNSQKIDDILKRDINIIQLIQLGRPNIALVKPEWGFEFVLTKTLTVLILAIVLRGLFNFFTITEKTMNLLHLPFLSKPAGVLDFISMSSIALDAVFLPTVAFLQLLCFGRHYQASIISWPLRIGLALLSTLLIGLGGFPNGYQESQIGGNTFEVCISVFAAWMELFGTYNLLKNLIEKPRIENYPYAKLISGIQNKLDDKVNEFYDLEPEQIKALGVRYLAPEQSESIQAILPQRQCYIKVRDVIKQCFWQSGSNQLPPLPLSSEPIEEINSTDNTPVLA